jgi:hypothetical protein
MEYTLCVRFAGNGRGSACCICLLAEAPRRRSLITGSDVPEEAGSRHARGVLVWMDVLRDLPILYHAIVSDLRWHIRIHGPLMQELSKSSGLSWLQITSLGSCAAHTSRASWRCSRRILNMVDASNGSALDFRNFHVGLLHCKPTGQPSSG